MYEVAFQVHYANLVDIGKVLVCAASQEQAADAAMQLLELPRSCTRCEVRRIKPSIWQLERREIRKDEPQRHYNGKPPPVSPYIKYHLQIDAVISARNESQVMRRVGESLIERVSGRKTGEQRTLDIIVECVPLHESKKAIGNMEKIEMYSARGGQVQGGQVRGR